MLEASVKADKQQQRLQYYSSHLRPLGGSNQFTSTVVDFPKQESHNNNYCLLELYQLAFPFVLLMISIHPFSVNFHSHTQKGPAVWEANPQRAFCTATSLTTAPHTFMVCQPYCHLLAQLLYLMPQLHSMVMNPGQ